MKTRNVVVCAVNKKLATVKEEFVNTFGFLVEESKGKCRNYVGQGTTEYAILVGVLVVIAILAITIFRPKIQELWDAISSGINGL